MPRAAGSGSHYAFALVRGGEPDPLVTVQLPSVTTILSVLSKPALLGWYYHTGLRGVAEMLARDGLKGATADELDGMLKEMGLRPWDLRDKAGARGTDVHDFLEMLAKGVKPSDVRTEEPDNGYLMALCDWWEAYEPEVVAAEVPVWSLRHGFAGTLDLVWRDGAGGVTLTDLKSSKAVYPDQMLQVAAYRLAWEEMGNDHVDRIHVVAVHEDGSYDERDNDVPGELFLRALELWRWQKDGQR